MKKELNIIDHKYIFLTISSLLVLISVVFIVWFGFRLGIDFTGGTLWQIKIENGNISVTDLKQFFVNNTDAKDINIQKNGNTNEGFIIRTKSITEEQHQKFLKKIQDKFGNINEERFESVGPSIGAQLKNKAIKASIFVLFAISLYIAFAFRKVSYLVKSWKYGIVALVTLFHDVIIPTGMLVILGHFYGVEMSTNFVVAMLVIMGYSINDTIVVFDRIRENLLKMKGNLKFDQIVNMSVNQTMARSINTSLTTSLILLALLVIGAGPLNLFVVTMLVGIIAGTYSSIFIASPLLTIWQKFGKK